MRNTWVEKSTCSSRPRPGSSFARRLDGDRRRCDGVAAREGDLPPGAESRVEPSRPGSAWRSPRRRRSSGAAPPRRGESRRCGRQPSRRGCPRRRARGPRARSCARRHRTRCRVPPVGGELDHAEVVVALELEGPRDQVAAVARGSDRDHLEEAARDDRRAAAGAEGRIRLESIRCETTENVVRRGVGGRHPARDEQVTVAVEVGGGGEIVVGASAVEEEAPAHLVPLGVDRTTPQSSSVVSDAR